MIQNYKLIITGLGNPIPQYQNTWHNIGKEALLEFAESLRSQSSYSFTDLSTQEKNEFITIQLNHKFSNITLLIPNNIYMNTIGSYLCKYISYKHILLTIYDDINLDVNKIKITPKPNRTHKGVLSILNNCKHKIKKLIWIKIGIKTTIYTNYYKNGLKDYVLTKIPKTYKSQIINNVYPKINNVLNNFIQNPALAMHGY